MNISALSIKHPVPAILLFILLTVFGVIGFQRLDIQQFPDMVDIGLPLWRRRLGQSACHKITSAAASLALLACPGLANAWGPQGHKTIGLIAEHYLTNSQRDEVQRLLALPIDPPVPANMADRATWADVYRDSDRNTTKERYNATHNWHFVEIGRAHV